MNKKYLDSETHVPQVAPNFNVDSMGEEQAVTAPVRRACHICHGMGGIETPSGDVRDCPNRNCESGYVIVKIVAK